MSRIPPIINPTTITVVGIVIILIMQGFAISDQRALINQNDIQQDQRSKAATEERQTAIDIGTDVKSILEQQGNLTKDAREDILNTLIRNEKIVIPELLNMSEANYNLTRFISDSFDEEYLIDEVRQYGQSNMTEKLLPEINEKLDRLLGSSNSSIGSP